MTTHNIYVPTMAEIHQAAYLTTRGWDYNEYEDKWLKPGLTHKVPTEAAADRGHWYEHETVDSEFWTLDDAYWHQRGLDEVDKTDKAG